MSNQPAVISTEHVTSSEGAICFDGREAVNAFAFLSLRQGVIFRIKTGHSLWRNQETRMARGYGWTNRARWTPALLDDLNKIGDAAGIKRADNDPTT